MVGSFMLVFVASLLLLAGPQDAPKPDTKPDPKPEVKASPQPPGYRLRRSIPLPGDEGWDYLAFDSDARRLYVTRGDRVVAVDAALEKVVGEIPVEGAHGVALAKELKRGFATAGRADSVTIFDLEKLSVLGKVAVGKGPDAIVHDTPSERVFAFNGGSGTATAIEAANGTVAGTVELGGRPEFGVSDGKGTVFVNLADTNEVVGFDARELKVRTRWPLAPCEDPTGIAMDRVKRRLFVGCRSRVMAVLDADGGKLLATLPIGKGVDSVAFDAERGLAFAANGDGTLTVVGEDAPGHFVVVENATTLPGARTVALDRKTHRLYLATAQFGPKPAATPENPQPHGAMVPGTFMILVVGK